MSDCTDTQGIIDALIRGGWRRCHTDFNVLIHPTERGYRLRYDPSTDELDPSPKLLNLLRQARA
jgi:hypothetical protein